MAWLQKQRGSNKWYIGFRVNGRERRKSTRTADRAEAQKQLDAVQALELARQAQAPLEAVYEALSGKILPRVTLAGQAAVWLGETRRSVAAASQKKYEFTMGLLLDDLQATEKGPLLAEVTTHDLQKFLGARAGAVSAGSVNLDRTILRIFFKHATDTGVLKVNPILHIEPFRDDKGAAAVKRQRKRTFTAQELRVIYGAAPSDFWRYMIIAGAYTGMRMGDLITLRVEEVDMQTHWIHREMGKVQGKFVHVPMAPPLADLLRQQILERAAGFIWPQEANRYNTKGAVKFCQQFSAILAKAGVATPRIERDRSEGDLRRDRGASFHLLRHFFVSSLKAAGASSAVAKALAGHSTDVINELYTHLPTETMAQAVQLLPDFLQGGAAPARIIP